MMAEATTFPGVGHTYEAHLGTDVFTLHFESDTVMHAQGVSGVNRGFDERETVRIQAIRPDLFMLFWQESSGSTVTLIQDFDLLTAYSTITIPDDDGTVFLRFEGDFKQLD